MNYTCGLCGSESVWVICWIDPNHRLDRLTELRDTFKYCKVPRDVTKSFEETYCVKCNKFGVGINVGPVSKESIVEESNE